MEFLTARDLLLAYHSSTRSELLQKHRLTIKRKSKRINGKVVKVYYCTDIGIQITPPENPSYYKFGMSDDNPLRSSYPGTVDNNLDAFNDFVSKLKKAVGLIYDGELVKVQVKDFNNCYDVVLGDFNLVIGYNRVYTSAELRPILDLYREHETKHGQNATGEKIKFTADGKLVSDLGNSWFYVATVTPDNEDVFIYQLVIDLADVSSGGDIYLNIPGYRQNELKNGSSGEICAGNPKNIEYQCNLWEQVEYNFGCYFYPAQVTGTELVTSDLLFNDKLSQEQADLKSERWLDGLMAIFGGNGKHTDNLQSELKAIKEAIFKIYKTNDRSELAQKITDNPTLLALVQSKIEQTGNQQYREVNSLLKAVDLVAWVNDNGSVSIGVYGGMQATKLDNGMTMHQRAVEWTEPKQQTHLLQLSVNPICI